MLKNYKEKKENIQESILNMGDILIEALKISLDSLEKEEIENLKKVELPIKKLAKKSNEIDNAIVAVLALYSPEAKDLRQLVSYLKITNELVRVGTNTKGFVKTFKKTFCEELNTKTILNYAIPLLKSSLLSVQSTMLMVKECDNKNIEKKHQKVLLEESKADDLYSIVQKDILKLSSQNVELSREYFDILSSLRKLEKISDRAASIANLLLFAQIGGELKQ